MSIRSILQALHLTRSTAMTEPTPDSTTAPAADQFSVTAAIIPANPKTGDTLTLAISGDDVQTTEVAGTIGPLTLALTAADGATTTLTVDAVPYTLVTSAPESVKISSVEDPTGRQWTISSDGLSATATA